MRLATRDDIPEIERIATEAAAQAPGFSGPQREAWVRVMAGMPWEDLTVQGIWLEPGGFACRLGDEVHRCYVDPAAQGRGIGARLMRHLETEARRGGLARLRLHTAANARGFYERLGYGVVATDNATLEGVSFERFVMTKALF